MQDVIYGWEPVVAVFAGAEHDRERAAGWVAAAGARVGARDTTEAAPGRLDLQAADAVLVWAGVDDADALAALLPRLNADAEAGRRGSVVLLPEALIDLAAALAPHPEVVLVAPPDPHEAVAALAVALAPHQQMVLEERGDEVPGQLRRLREEVGRIARALAEMSGEEERARASPVAVPAPVADLPVVTPAMQAARLRALIRARRARDQFWEADLFADPAWDMLLDLALARAERRLVAVSSLCIAAAVPPTTALRWIKRLTDEGLFIRSADPRDGRRVFIDLSEACAERMDAFLRLLGPLGPG